MATNAALSLERDPRTLAPALPLLAREVAAFAWMRSRASFARAVPLAVEGKARPVLVLPGFMASDITTARLRRSLDAAGFESHGWGLGRNLGVTADIFDRLDTRLDALNIEVPVTLIGWSLGGLVAREYAKRSPERVAKVITLGSPFSGDPRANNAWRLYEWVAGHSVDSPPIETILSEKPPVPTIAFWSANDGVVAQKSARGGRDEADERLELHCTHMAFVADPAAIRAVAKAI